MSQLIVINRITHFEKHTILSLANLELSSIYGRVKKVSGTLVEAGMPKARLGELCEIYIDEDTDSEPLLAEVIGFCEKSTLLSTLSTPVGLSMGMTVKGLGCRHRVRISPQLLGHVFDGVGRLLDGGEGIFCKDTSQNRMIKDVVSDPVPATQKPRIDEPLISQIKVIDSMLTIGKGQRIGLFAGAGCGKTTLLASLARGCSAHIIVIALIGERGRELKEFLDHELDEELKKKTVVVCATSDRSSMERSRAAFTATAIAEGFRDQGLDVLLLVDSLTRFARAQREIGLAAKEPPAKGGFPPSVYTMLPRLIERAGKTTKGSITAIYTLLLEGDSMADPIADEAKSLLDGHIVMSRELAQSAHYPAIDVQKSLSRTMGNVVPKEHQALAAKIRQYLSTYEEMELLIKLGEYQEGNDEKIDEAVRKFPDIMRFFQQGCNEEVSMKDAISQLQGV